MNPFDDEGLLNMTTGPGALSQVNAMVTQGNDQARRDALSSGLIGAGAGLLGYDKSMGPAAGMGAALAGFNRAYDTQLVANRPKVTPLANGAFVLVQYPDGRQEIVKNDEVAKYMSDKSAKDLEVWKAKEQFKGDVQADVAGRKEDIKNAPEARQAAESTDNLIKRYEDAVDIVMPIQRDAQGNPVVGPDGQPVRQPRGRMDQATALPGIKGVAEFFGADSAAANQKLQELTVDETLLKTAQTKGAISNAEMDLFKSPMPQPWADPKVWEEKARARLTVLRKIKAFQESEAARGETATGRSGGGSMSPSAIPGLSPSAAKYFQ